jgi:hypothetical protein
MTKVKIPKFLEKFLGNKFVKGTLDVVKDPGVLFSVGGAIVFSSSTPVIAVLGLASFATTTGISVQRKLFPEYTGKIANKIDGILKGLGSPGFEQKSLPLYVSGLFLAVVGSTALLTGQYSMAAIGLSFALANTSKASKVSGGWGIKDITSKVVNGVVGYTPLGNFKKPLRLMQRLKNSNSRILNHTLYLPEFWSGTGGLIVGVLGSGIPAVIGAGFAAAGVGFAGINNNDPLNPAYRKSLVRLKKHFDGVRNAKETSPGKWFIQRIDRTYEVILPKSIRGEFEKLCSENNSELVPSDAVMSRKQMRNATAAYSIFAALSGNLGFAVANFAASVANHELANADMQQQKALLRSSESDLIARVIKGDNDNEPRPNCA